MTKQVTREEIKIVGTLEELFRIAERHQRLEELASFPFEFPDIISFDEFERSYAREEGEVSRKAEKIINKLEKLAGAAVNTSPFPPLPTSTLQFLWDLKRRDRFYCLPPIHQISREKLPTVLESYLEDAVNYLAPRASVRITGDKRRASLSEVGIFYPAIQDFIGNEFSLVDGNETLMKVRFGSISPRKEILQLNVYPATYSRLKLPATTSLYEIISPFMWIGKRNSKNWLERVIDGLSDRGREEILLERDKQMRERKYKQSERDKF
ncbi:MAG: hypothetical protein QW507_01940 [Candidatus Nanoarchaeia archaeon]|nr:hypothetical protein [Candidatus Haiyanarchaeum thermophilum]MCW1302824.1 hypothetical protein [Candidatus Haiyanarchaeum thermophilum]MCW1303505.1 hypothetical protein [Candidatus Haiyanarchaeum thermophilum]MCW1306685.1 hypothetical protein [Candidatus Haiyanarchaeum thermophilum]MCW1307359.1 hypothetical protein [Candidatus Haiyanarchaeum thermophilum]